MVLLLHLPTLETRPKNLIILTKTIYCCRIMTVIAMNKKISIIESIALEVTRRCNEKCLHCMRGESENLDIEKSTIDSLLEKNNILIMKLIFSGGEPLLNEEAIIYTIDKIINEKKLVFSIEITTNGTIYSKLVLEKLKEFKHYVETTFKEFPELIAKEEISCLRISDDQFHKVDKNVEAKYLKEKDIAVQQTGYIDELDDKIILTGRAKNRMFGRHFKYHLIDVDIKELSPTCIWLKNDFYITAKGDITTQGNGTYEDMDFLNLGKIEDYNFINREKNNIKK